jgi:HAD superfamily hydrolase (TIGR01484 family)
MATSPVKMIAIDVDGTLLGPDGQISQRNSAALKAAQAAGIQIVIATGRRHVYALKVLHEIELASATVLISSNGAVVRQFDGTLVERTLMPLEVARWLCRLLDEFRNALVITFDKVDANGEEQRGALVIEEIANLSRSIDRWMIANEPYIAHVCPIEDSLQDDSPIQMMLTGSVERMRRAEAVMSAHPSVRAVGDLRTDGLISLNRTEYPERDLSIVDILPVGCAKGAAIARLAAAAGIDRSEIMAIGDNWNDLSMLELAGHPVLMGNAPEDLLVQAQAQGWTTAATHHQDGVAQVIESVLRAQLYEPGLLVTA